MDENIYDDLNGVDLGGKITKLQDENCKLIECIKTLRGDIEKLCKELTHMKTTERTLTNNISELFNTAKTEIQRKDRIVADLRREIDDLIFKRYNKPINRVDNASGNENAYGKRSRNDSEEILNKKIKCEPVSKSLHGDTLRQTESRSPNGRCENRSRSNSCYRSNGHYGNKRHEMSANNSEEIVHKKVKCERASKSPSRSILGYTKSRTPNRGFKSRSRSKSCYRSNGHYGNKGREISPNNSEEILNKEIKCERASKSPSGSILGYTKLTSPNRGFKSRSPSKSCYRSNGYYGNEHRRETSGERTARSFSRPSRDRTVVKSPRRQYFDRNRSKSRYRGTCEGNMTKHIDYKSNSDSKSIMQNEMKVEIKSEPFSRRDRSKSRYRDEHPSSSIRRGRSKSQFRNEYPDSYKDKNSSSNHVFDSKIKENRDELSSNSEHYLNEIKVTSKVSETNLLDDCFSNSRKRTKEHCKMNYESNDFESKSRLFNSQKSNELPLTKQDLRVKIISLQDYNKRKLGTVNDNSVDVKCTKTPYESGTVNNNTLATLKPNDCETSDTSATERKINDCETSDNITTERKTSEVPISNCVDIPTEDPSGIGKNINKQSNNLNVSPNDSKENISTNSLSDGNESANSSFNIRNRNNFNGRRRQRCVVKILG